MERSSSLSFGMRRLPFGPSAVKTCKEGTMSKGDLIQMELQTAAVDIKTNA